jgi:uncharacterized protein
MTPEVAEAIFEGVMSCRRLDDPINFVWHAGEPLTVPPAFYRDVLDRSARIARHHRREVTHTIQTNGTLINDDWARLFREYGLRIGISLDGPAFIHDRQRQTRSGRGTHADVMRGIGALRAGGVEFNVIMVLTRFALDYPDEIYRFLIEHSIRRVGFNIDELEGTHETTSYATGDAIEAYRAFLRRFLRLVDDGGGALAVRELGELVPAILLAGADLPDPVNTTNTALHLLTFDYRGDYSTFCPELSGTRSERFSDFVMGNIFEGPIDRIFEDPTFLAVDAEIRAGVKACEESCPYWRLCGGGAPSNKYFEHGRFDVTETIACRVQKQATVDVLLEYLEGQLASPLRLESAS